MSIELVISSKPLSSPSPPAFNLSQQQGLFQCVGSLHQVDWLDLLAVQATFKSLLQHHSSKASSLLCLAFFIVQLSYPHKTTGKTTALTKWTFVSKVTSLLFNMLSRLVIAFLPRSKCLNFMTIVTIWSSFGAPKYKICHGFQFPHLFAMK